ncbi:unnamed protein product [Moneuplotes crassus]|uniref:Uncharacterized protein n=1 Tax=Euplotes crassus TaxID=5936 RepID=A0AAD1YAH9_EUPCR|nr:unnamed protein product [Moneuplotes crassus]
MALKKFCIKDTQDRESQQIRIKRTLKQRILALNKTTVHFQKKDHDYRSAHLKKRVFSFSPSSYSHKNKLHKTQTRMLKDKNHGTPHRRICSPVPQRIHKLKVHPLEAKKKPTNLKICRKMRKTPLENLKARIRSLSPDINKVVQSALSHSNKRSKRDKKSKKKFKGKDCRKGISTGLIPIEENMKKVFGYVSNKFETLHSKITDLKSSPGLCQSSYILNQKLMKLQSSKEKISTEDQVLRVHSNNFMN